MLFQATHQSSSKAPFIWFWIHETTLPLNPTQTNVYIREHIVPVGRFIVDPTQLFMNNPNWIIKCAISFPWLFSHIEFCLLIFSSIQTSALNFKCWHVAFVTLRVVPVIRAKLFRAFIKGCNPTNARCMYEKLHPPELSSPRVRFAIFMWMVGTG